MSGLQRLLEAMEATEAAAAGDARAFVGEARQTTPYVGASATTSATSTARATTATAATSASPSALSSPSEILAAVQPASALTGFPCPSCGRIFAKKWNALVHNRVHSKERPFACTEPGCHRTYMWRSSLKSHVRSHGNARVRPAGASSCAAVAAAPVITKRRPRSAAGGGGRSTTVSSSATTASATPYAAPAAAVVIVTRAPAEVRVPAQARPLVRHQSAQAQAQSKLQQKQKQQREQPALLAPPRAAVLLS
jgi:hypothetical protein